ncbi:MAG: GNAT family N-acetyltransferase [Clostridia bacterium]|nr:GNAT family N-acetyltransferase [Clostridia bacterium]
MIYFESQDIIIRNMQPGDVKIIASEEEKQGWGYDDWKYEKRLRHQAEGKCVSFVCEYKGEVAGYINLYNKAGHGPFAGSGYPEIVDFGVLQKFRNRGVGSALMDTAEALAKETSDTVTLGVGLYTDYGAAQRMYIKRGYIPDGSGVWYRNENCPPYAEIRNDDDLVLYLSKKL